jgi:hypothetical protein
MSYVSQGWQVTSHEAKIDPQRPVLHSTLSRHWGGVLLEHTLAAPDLQARQNATEPAMQAAAAAAIAGAAQPTTRMRFKLERLVVGARMR